MMLHQLSTVAMIALVHIRVWGSPGDQILSERLSQEGSVVAHRRAR